MLIRVVYFLNLVARCFFFSCDYKLMKASSILNVNKTRKTDLEAACVLEHAFELKGKTWAIYFNIVSLAAFL